MAEGAAPGFRQRRPPGLGLTLAASPKHQEVQKEHVSVCSGSSCQDASLVYRYCYPCAKLQRGLVSRKSRLVVWFVRYPSQSLDEMTQSVWLSGLPFQVPPSPSCLGLPLALSMHTDPVDSPGHHLSRLFPPEATRLSVDHNRIRGMQVQTWPRHLSCPFLLRSLR